MIILSYILFIMGMSPFIINNRVEVFIVSSLILVVALILMAIASKRAVDLSNEIVSIRNQVFAVVIITIILFMAQAWIHDASPFPFMNIGNLAAFCSSLLFILIFKYVKKGAKILVVCLIITLVGVPFAYFYPHNVQWSDTNKLQRKLEFQFAYKYKDDIYYASNRRDGIYKTTSYGDTTKIADSHKPTYKHDITLWVNGNEAYFVDNSEKWKSINLDTMEIKNQPDFKVDNSAHQQQEYAFIGEGTVQEKIGYVRDSQVSGDGYIYFLTGSTNEGIKSGIYRVEINSKEYELLVDGESISMFDVEDGLLTYYDVNNTPPISTLQLPNQ